MFLISSMSDLVPCQIGGHGYDSAYSTFMWGITSCVLGSDPIHSSDYASFRDQPHGRISFLDHAIAWAASQDRAIPPHGTPAFGVLYAQWIEWAFGEEVHQPHLAKTKGKKSHARN